LYSVVETESIFSILVTVHRRRHSVEVRERRVDAMAWSFRDFLPVLEDRIAPHSTTYLHTAVPAEVQGLKSAQWMKNGALAAAAKACREIESVNTVAVWASMGQDRQEYGYGMLC
jgi:hypothetical protein